MYSGGVGKEVYDHEIVFWGFTSNYEGIEFFPFAVGVERKCLKGVESIGLS